MKDHEDVKSVQDLHNEIDRLKEELAYQNSEVERLEADRVILGDLFDRGIINDKGNFLQ